jgi:hypothetical protein
MVPLAFSTGAKITTYFSRRFPSAPFAIGQCPVRMGYTGSGLLDSQRPCPDGASSGRRIRARFLQQLYSYQLHPRASRRIQPDNLLSITGVDTPFLDIEGQARMRHQRPHSPLVAGLNPAGPAVVSQVIWPNLLQSNASRTARGLCSSGGYMRITIDYFARQLGSGICACI